MSQLKFSGNQSAFYSDLKERVNQYFAKRNKRQYGDHRIYLKAGVLLTTFFTTFIILVFFTPPVWLSILLCVVLGLATAGIGVNVMHDGSHGRFSSNLFVNRLATLTINFLGASPYFWKL